MHRAGRGRVVTVNRGVIDDGIGAGPSESAPAGTRHIPALDGLRGLAVAGVLFFHGGHLVGGYLGVDLFFVLSGFLITSLLLGESTTRGSVSLGGFWARRARRLLPALGGVLVGVALYGAFLADPLELRQIRGDALATIGYVANWRAVFTHRDYWALFAAPSPLEHTWSLAIEEQFYVVWPLVFVGLLARWKRRTPAAVLVVSLVLAGVSNVLMFVLYDPGTLSRTYYGTDTRAGGILLGAALAAWLVVRGHAVTRRGRLALEGAAIIAAFGLAVAWVRLDGQSPTLYRGGFLLCGLAVVVLLAASAHPQAGPTARLLSFRPFRLLGLISYGVYLWHWPVDVALNHQRAHLGGWLLFALQTATTLALAITSYFLLERPIRRGALSARSWRALTPAIAIALVLVLLVSTQGATSPPAVASSNASAIAAAVREARAAQKATRVMVVGNSVAYFLGRGLQQVNVDPPTVTLNAARLGCFFPADISVVRFHGPAGNSQLRSASCDPQWPEAVRQFRPDIVLIVLSGALNGEAKIGGRWVHSCDPAFDANFESGLRRALTVLGAGGAKVVITTAAYNRLGYGNFHDGGVDCDNRVRRRVATSTGAPLVDLFSWVCPDGRCRATDHGVLLRVDGLHYEGAGARAVARWLLDQLLSEGLR